MPNVADLWQQAVNYHKAGHVVQAAQLYREILVIDQRHHAAMNYLGVALIENGEIDPALDLFIRSVHAAPRSADYWLNYGVALESIGRLDDAADCFEKARTIDPSDLKTTIHLAKLENRRKAYRRTCELLRPLVSGNPEHLDLLDTLVVAHHHLGDNAESARLARETLVLRDKRATANDSTIQLIARNTPEPPSPKTCGRNVIAFSLWGDARRYVAGAIDNIRRAAIHLPYWTVRIYADQSVPADAIATMTSLGAEIIRRQDKPPFTSALFWRFEPIKDVALDRVCIRDADSLIGSKEASAVNEWVASGKSFHIMRDHCCNNELILAGLWGAVCGTLNGFSRAAAKYKLPTINKWRDQGFLRAEVWPVIKHHALIHDSHFELFGAQPFPTHSPDPDDPPFVGATYLQGPPSRATQRRDH